MTERQTGLLALGGTIGAGVFLGMGDGLRLAGAMLPLLFAGAALLTYAVTRALGELATAHGGRVTFVTLSAATLGRRTAFVQGWAYWAAAILACMAQLTALRGFLGDVITSTSWTVPPLALLLLAAANRLGVRRFGSIEAAMASVKLVVLAVVVVLGIAVAVMAGDPVGRIHRMPSPASVSGLLISLPIVLFAFGNAELVALASVDLEDAQRILGRTIRRFVARLAVLHVGVAAALLVLVPPSRLAGGANPFVQLLAGYGVAGGGRIVNVVLACVMLSSCNACLYGAARALRSLAAEGCAPALLGRSDQNGSPGPAIGLSMIAVTLLIVLSSVPSGGVFGLLLGAAATVGLINWALFLLAHLRFRRAAGRSTISSVAALAGVVGALVAICAQPPLTLAAVTAIAALTILVAAGLFVFRARPAASGTGAAPCRSRTP